MATKAAKSRTYRSIPYPVIATMWDEGKSYEAIAKRIKRFDPKASDPTKPTRAIVSRMLNEGWHDEDGKLHTLKARAGMRNIGVGKKAPGAGKTKSAAKPVKAAAGRKGSPIVVNLTDNGKFIRVKLDGHSAKAPVDKVQPQLIGVLDTLGFSVVAKETPVAQPAVETPAPAETAAAEVAPTPVVAQADPAPQAETAA